MALVSGSVMEIAMRFESGAQAKSFTPFSAFVTCCASFAAASGGVETAYVLADTTAAAVKALPRLLTLPSFRPKPRRQPARYRGRKPTSRQARCRPNRGDSDRPYSPHAARRGARPD